MFDFMFFWGILMCKNEKIISENNKNITKNCTQTTIDIADMLIYI